MKNRVQNYKPYEVERHDSSRSEVTQQKKNLPNMKSSVIRLYQEHGSLQNEHDMLGTFDIIKSTQVFI